MNEKPEPLHVHVKDESAVADAVPFPPTIWLADNFAKDWFSDALHEARCGLDHHSRRREIVFAVCFAESYIVEWARNMLPVEEIRDLPLPKKLKDKWKHVPKEVCACVGDKIEYDPNLGDLGQLLRYRHGLVHAAASLPATNKQPQKEKPFPTKKRLQERKPGWAVRIVVALVRDLHQAVGTCPPKYLQDP